jgi:DNA polymerase delta subunit 1
VKDPKNEIFGDIIAQHKPPPKKKEPSLSGMKKEDLVKECQRLGLDDTGKVADLKERIKAKRSVEDIFKNYEQS